MDWGRCGEAPQRKFVTLEITAVRQVASYKVVNAPVPVSKIIWQRQRARLIRVPCSAGTCNSLLSNFECRGNSREAVLSWDRHSWGQPCKAQVAWWAISCSGFTFALLIYFLLLGRRWEFFQATLRFLSRCQTSLFCYLTLLLLEFSGSRNHGSHGCCFNIWKVIHLNSCSQFQTVTWEIMFVSRTMLLGWLSSASFVRLRPYKRSKLSQKLTTADSSRDPCFVLMYQCPYGLGRRGHSKELNKVLSLRIFRWDQDPGCLNITWIWFNSKRSETTYHQIRCCIQTIYFLWLAGDILRMVVLISAYFPMLGYASVSRRLQLALEKAIYSGIFIRNTFAPSLLGFPNLSSPSGALIKRASHGRSWYFMGCLA